MSGKRRADRDLNPENCEDEEEREDAGTFKKASPEEMRNRVLKIARRRKVAPPKDDLSSDSSVVEDESQDLGDDRQKNAFADFAFASRSSPPKDAFSFLLKATSSGASSSSHRSSEGSSRLIENAEENLGIERHRIALGSDSDEDSKLSNNTVCVGSCSSKSDSRKSDSNKSDSNKSNSSKSDKGISDNTSDLSELSE